MNTVIIGTAKGLGLCLTEKLLEKGLRVAAGTLSITSGLASLKEKYKDNLLIFDADVTDERQIEENAKICFEYFGEFDSICIVAGVLLDGDRVNPLHLCNINDLKKTFEVNLFGPIAVVKAYYPYMSSGANVFIVTSEGAAITNCGSWIPCYSMSKTSATKACGILNQTVHNVNFYAVHPGRMNTDMGRTTAQIEPEESAIGFCHLITGDTPLSREHWYIDYNGNNMIS
jgi:NAD(P)-dependent dehydrogenase (short-subunit alcohol dehydrogenase family)